MEIQKIATLEDLLGQEYKGLTDMYRRIAEMMGIVMKDGYKFDATKITIAPDFAAILFDAEVKFVMRTADITEQYSQLDALGKQIINKAIEKNVNARLNKYGPQIDHSFTSGRVEIVGGFVTDENGEEVLPDTVDTAQELLDRLHEMAYNNPGNTRLN